MIIISLFCLSCSKEDKEEGSKTTFQKTYGESGYDAAEEALIINDVLYIVGTTDRNGNSQKDILFMALDMDGNELFSKTYGDPMGDDEGFGMVETTDGNIMLIGYTENIPGNKDCYILKIDLLGNVMWGNVYGGPGEDVANDIVLLDNGEIFVVGHTDYWGTDRLKSYYLWVNLDGGVIREKIFSLHEDDLYYSAASCIQSADGQIHIFGHFDNDGSNRDLFWQEMTSEGTYSSTLFFGADGYDEAQQLIQSADGHMLLCSHSTESDPLHNMMVSKLDPSDPSGPEFVWESQYGGTKHDGGMAILENSKGNYVAVARSNSFRQGDENIYMVEINQTGEIIRDKVFGGAVTDRAECILEHEGYYYLIGRSDSYGKKMQVYIVKTKI